ncbi:MAG: polyprenyl diphosphate synthase [Gammaproteobacteria bacterium]|nr:polyprenyl diphosphate synthase [Gammaproteobacteria bacterium]
MDGNGRWAAGRRLPRHVGHRAGYRVVRNLVRLAIERDIRHLTLFAFSSENWKRPEIEVSALMKLFLQALRREVNDLDDNGVKLDFLGARERLSAPLRKLMEETETRTAGNDRLRLHVAVSFGGRWDIVSAARRLSEAAAAGRMDPASVDEAALRRAMSLPDMPDPDLLIRTGGECRISNFLLWNLAYTELYFTDVLWPDFDAAQLDAALGIFSRRHRRFGTVTAGAEHA